MHQAATTPVAVVDEVAALEDPSGRLHGVSLDVPAAGHRSEGHAVEVAGWVAGRTAAAERVEVLHLGVPVLSLPVGAPRPDVAEAFPDLPGAGASGFAGSLGTLRAPTNYDLEVRAVLADGDAVPIARLRGRRRPLPPSHNTGIQPLLLTTLGRTGSTWFTWLLQQHPEVYCYRPFEVDSRVGTYWMTILQRLSDPTSALSQIMPGGPMDGEWWLGRTGLTTGALGDPDLERWLAGESVHELADLMAGRIQAIYRQLAGSANPRFFLEKHTAGQIAAELLTEVFPGAREVVLVRDFRDTFCSVRAFNRKRGHQGFGRDAVASDEQYVEHMRLIAQALLNRWRERAGDAWLVRYEDLILDPPGTLRPMLRFLGVDEGLAEDMLASATREVHAGMEQHMTAPDPAASIGRWRSDLGDPLKDLCTRAFAPIHEAFGYPAGDY